MLTVVLLALAVVAGVPLGVVAVAAIVAWRPLLVVPLAAGWAVWNRRRVVRARPGPDDEARYLRAVAAELRAGAPPARAVAVASDDPGMARVRRLAAAGMAAERVADELGAALPATGALAGAAYRIVTETGARAADVFERLAGTAARLAETARERRVQSAQARASAAVVALVPLGFSALVALGSGTLEAAGEIGMVLLGAGVALELLGAAVVVWMVRR